MASTQPHQTPGSSQPLVVSTASGKNRVLPTASASPASGKKNREQYFVIVRNFSSNQIISIFIASGTATAMNSSAAAALTAMSMAPNSNQPNQDLASLFECPVCFDYVLPPILQVSSVFLISSLKVLQFDDISFQCHAGHLVCSSCRPKLTCCPTCRGQLGGNIR